MYQMCIRAMECRGKRSAAVCRCFLVLHYKRQEAKKLLLHEITLCTASSPVFREIGKLSIPLKERETEECAEVFDDFKYTLNLEKTTTAELDALKIAKGR